jgi:hypothetical protein
MTESWQSNSLMFGQSLVSENNLRLNSTSAQLGKYLMVTVRGRVEQGTIPQGNAPYIFVIRPRPGGYAAGLSVSMANTIMQRCADADKPARRADPAAGSL